MLGKLLLAVVASMAVAALAACGGDDSEATIPNEPTTEREARAKLGSWSTASAAAPEREDAASVTANDHVYVIGGKDARGDEQSTVSSARLNADGSLGEWATTTALPAPRQDHNAVVAGGRLYVIGGGGPDDTVYSAPLNADATVGTWRSETSLPLALDDPASVVAGDHLYVMGGLNGTVRDGVHRAPIERDGTLGAWQTSADPLPDGGRAEHTAFAANGHLYVVGGGNPDVQDEVFSAPLNADGSTGVWQTQANLLPQPRLDHTTVVSDGVAYVIGGIDGSSAPQSTVYSATLNADGSTGPWGGDTALPAAREDASTVLHDGYVYVFAGKSGAGPEATTVYSKLPSP
jgi:N-acetylneuraminic acid mutarotase